EPSGYVDVDGRVRERGHGPVFVPDRPAPVIGTLHLQVGDPVNLHHQAGKARPAGNHLRVAAVYVETQLFSQDEDGDRRYGARGGGGCAVLARVRAGAGFPAGATAREPGRALESVSVERGELAISTHTGRSSLDKAGAARISRPVRRPVVPRERARWFRVRSSLTLCLPSFAS